MHPTLALFQRNAWATARLLNWCQYQPAAAAAAGEDVYGDVEATFNHILAAEALYLRLLTGETQEDPVSERSPRPLAELHEPARRLAERWREVLATELDLEAIRLHKREDGDEEMPDWLLLVQAVHHGDDHRAQIGTLLGRAEVITPELDGWSFGFEPRTVGMAPAWADTMLRRSTGHHLWATRRLLESCQSLSDDQLGLSSAGTYGSILDTLRHLVSADRGYLSRLNRAGRPAPIETGGVGELIELWDRQRAGWLEYVEAEPDYESTVECKDGWYPAWILTLQAIHHGNDHRTHVGTVMLGHGIEMPELDVWSYAWAEGSFKVVEAS